MLALFALTASSQAAPAREAAYCQRVALIDAESGAPVRGAEDIAVDADGGRLYLSAYDRWALEDALAADAERLPQGGIYAAPLSEVAAAEARLSVRRLTSDVAGDFHPHGIALYREADPLRLFAINHAYSRRDGERRRATRIDVFDLAGDSLQAASSLRDEALCQANDLVALSPSDVLVSRDHGACRGLRRWSEDALGLSHAKVLLARLEEGGAARVRTLVDGLGFANGLALSPDKRRLAVAATREGRVHFFDVPALKRGEAAPLSSVRLDGGPDNLSWTPGGKVLAAVHPSMLKAGMARNRWLGARRAGSRVVAIDPDDGTVAPLLEDPEGRKLNMATVAAAFGERIVVAAVLDDAVLVCNPPSRDAQANDTGRDAFHSQ
ncbi:hypothetical protein [Ferruginivarius sediminum]|uniref:Uncharacterized protein n=1 Tax=Ferruginivarius sediminum TaxID=2661937 RepID=A0A369TBA6_9PROT|nr:hypothetical protein [Ferruginivarius sediminum]RDD61794.1 hypothetical protein DRB17_11425 [Ferruginivarius sediminum]